MAQATASVRRVSTSRKRLSKIADARDTLAGFDHGVEIDVATFGQFSLIDAIEAILDVTGPASVTLATWTAAEFDLTQIEAQLLRAQITDLRLIIDRSFVSRQPRFVRVELVDALGDEAEFKVGPEFEAYCSAVTRLRDAQARIRAEELIVPASKNAPVAHPAYAIERQASDDLRKWGDKFKPR